MEEFGTAMMLFVLFFLFFPNSPRRVAVAWTDAAQLSSSSSPLQHPWCPARGPFGPRLSAACKDSALTQRIMCYKIKRRETQSRVMWNYCGRGQWQSNTGWKSDSPISSILCAVERRSSAGASAATEDSKHKLWSWVGHWESSLPWA